jgi:hypothetical protein
MPRELTFKEWQKEGRRIHKGSVGKVVDGKVVFPENMTYKYPSLSPFHSGVKYNSCSQTITGPWDDPPH